jgi:WD40 repeat protein
MVSQLELDPTRWNKPELCHWTRDINDAFPGKAQLRLSPNGDYAAPLVSRSERSFIVVALRTGVRVDATLDVGIICTVAWSPDSRWLAVLTNRGELRLFEVRWPHVRQRDTVMLSCDARALAWSADSRRIYYMFSTLIYGIYDRTTRTKESVTLEAHLDRVFCAGGAVDASGAGTMQCQTATDALHQPTDARVVNTTAAQQLDHPGWQASKRVDLRCVGDSLYALHLRADGRVLLFDVFACRCVIEEGPLSDTDLIIWSSDSRIFAIERPRSVEPVPRRGRRPKVPTTLPHGQIDAISVYDIGASTSTGFANDCIVPRVYSEVSFDTGTRLNLSPSGAYALAYNGHGPQQWTYLRVHVLRKEGDTKTAQCIEISGLNQIWQRVWISTWSSDERFLCVVTVDNRIVVFDVKRDFELLFYIRLAHRVDWLEFTPNCDALVAVCNDGIICHYPLLSASRQH